MKRLPTILPVLLVLVVSTFGQQRLLAVGGGDRPPEAMKIFAEWSGGDKGRILIVTWASGEPIESFDSLRKDFNDVSKAVIRHAPIPPLDAAKRTEFVKELNAATGVFFAGGDQNRIMDVLKDEDLLKMMREKYAKGIPFGGTSAGTAVLSDPMITGDADLKVLDGSKVGVRKGIGFVPNVIFDQHFLVRQRQNRLFGLIMLHPKMLGIGIDEDTAVLIEDNRRLRIVGKTQVMFVNGKSPTTMQVSILNAGRSYDLGKRQEKADAKSSFVSIQD
jgi:cyanophycinase